MRAILFSIFIFGTRALFGQVDGNNLILTEEKNENWFAHLRQCELKDQIELINNRILLDTNVLTRSGTDRYIAEHLNGRHSGYCKPIIVAGGIPIYIENRTKGYDIKHLTGLLNTKTIKSIEIVDVEKAKAIYGSRGECKAILMTLKKKSTKRKLKKLDVKMHPPKYKFSIYF